MADDIQFKVRIPVDLHQRLLVSAAMNYRSATAEIAAILAQHFGADLTDEERDTIAKASAILARTGQVNTAHKNSEG